LQNLFVVQSQNDEIMKKMKKKEDKKKIEKEYETV
jgi:hypothetical protein